jgi:glycosyltransferase involved in cell wall biosynthesis
MQLLSVVIVCRNEAAIIGHTLESLRGLTDDIIVYDNGSTDGTAIVARQFPVIVHEGSWEGFGKTKNSAIALARYNWILSLDADEAIDTELKNTLLALPLNDAENVYQIKFKNFFGNTWLKYGEWGNDKHIRLFNRVKVKWNEAPVHEQLILPEGAKIIKLKGSILHYTAPDIEKYKTKLTQYATLNAKKYYEQGKKAGPLKKYAAAIFSFIQNYIFRAGFLDGKAGYQCAALMAAYTFKKYKKLESILQEKQNGKTL